jgi:hypothetical protein
LANFAIGAAAAAAVLFKNLRRGNQGLAQIIPRRIQPHAAEGREVGFDIPRSSVPEGNSYLTTTPLACLPSLHFTTRAPARQATMTVSHAVAGDCGRQWAGMPEERRAASAALLVASTRR